MNTPRCANRIALALAVTLTAAFASDSALARRGHHHPRLSVGLHIGVPLLGFPYYYPPYPYYYPAYYPSPIVVQPPPTVYIEQPAPQPQVQQPSAGYWYFCNDSRAYYPYVKECPGGWQRVAPQPN